VRPVTTRPSREELYKMWASSPALKEGRPRSGVAIRLSLRSERFLRGESTPPTMPASRRVSRQLSSSC